jgi:hypothetical protein
MERLIGSQDIWYGKSFWSDVLKPKEFIGLVQGRRVTFPWRTDSQVGWPPKNFVGVRYFVPEQCFPAMGYSSTITTILIQALFRDVKLKRAMHYVLEGN